VKPRRLCHEHLKGKKNTEVNGVLNHANTFINRKKASATFKWYPNLLTQFIHMSFMRKRILLASVFRPRHCFSSITLQKPNWFLHSWLVITGSLKQRSRVILEIPTDVPHIRFSLQSIINPLTTTHYYSRITISRSARTTSNLPATSLHKTPLPLFQHLSSEPQRQFAAISFSRVGSKSWISTRFHAQLQNITSYRCQTYFKGPKLKITTYTYLLLTANCWF